MASQFEKRKSKTVEEATKEVAEVLAAKDVKMPFTGYDIYSEDGGKSFGVAEIEYNPETGAAKVINKFTISRLVALQYKVQKDALGTLNLRH